MSHKSDTSSQLGLAPVRQRVRPNSAGLSQPKDQTADSAPEAASASEDDGYIVGYCKPPKESQFKAGFDPRRPKGRKAGSKNKANGIVAMMESPTMVRTPEGGVRTISTEDAMARKLRELGLSGNLPAISKAFELYLKARPPSSAGAFGEQSEPDIIAQSVAVDQAIIACFESEVLARAKSGSKA
jgi:hypothetical protein